jgi:hypothetical protein
MADDRVAHVFGHLHGHARIVQAHHRAPAAGGSFSSASTPAPMLNKALSPAAHP